MNALIPISELNDFIFCPLSIYYHNLYGNFDKILYQTDKQLDGTDVHESIEKKSYSNRKNMLQAISVCSMKYGLIGKIDILDTDGGILIERKKHIGKIYDGYIFQLYAQYFALKEMGYTIKKIKLYSYDDNKSYDVTLPEEDPEMFNKFEKLITEMKTFDMSSYHPKDIKKCRHCIYSNLCAESLYD